MIRRHVIDGLTRTGGRPSGQRQQAADLLVREAEVAGAPDEGQAVQMRPLIDSVAALPAIRLVEQSDPLIVADGDHLAASASPKLADRKSLRHQP